MNKIFEKICGILLLIAVMISFSEIIMRVIFNISYDIIIDLPVWITVWASILIAGPILINDEHISIDIIRSKLKGKVRLFVEFTNSIACLIFGLVILLGGIKFVYQLYQRKAVFPRYIPVPMWIIEFCIPLGMLLFCYFSLFLAIKVLRKKW